MVKDIVNNQRKPMNGLDQAKALYAPIGVTSCSEDDPPGDIGEEEESTPERRNDADNEQKIVDEPTGFR